MDCEISMRVWKASVLGINSRVSRGIEAGEWVSNFIRFLMMEDGNKGSRITVFVSILWSIWLHRNECMFKGAKASPLAILDLSSVWVERWVSSADCLGVSGSAAAAIDSPAVAKGYLWWGCGSIEGEDMLLIEVDEAWKQCSKEGDGRWTAVAGWRVTSKGQLVKEGV